MAADDTNGAGEAGEARSVKSRRDRLASLRARHQDVASTPAAPRIPGPLAGTGGLGGGAGRRKPAAVPAMGAAARPKVTPQQKQMLARLYRMLTQGPDDGSGTMPGTPFRRSGVERIMGLLAERAQAAGAPGFKVAQSALRFIEAKGDEESFGGASVEKLRMLAGRIESVRAHAGGGAAAPGGGE